jgi:cell division protein FtsL
VLQAGNAALRQRPEPLPHKTAVPAGRPRARTFTPGKKLLPALILVACFLLGLVVIAQYSSTVTLQYRLGHAERRLDELKYEYNRLELEAARLGSLARIELVARVELGMREPESGQLRVLTAGQENSVNSGE